MDKKKKKNSEGFLKNIILYLNCELNKDVKIENPLSSLIIFRTYIEDVHPERECCLEWSENFFDKFTEEIENRQNKLININIIELIVSNIEKDTQDLRIFEESLLLAIAILYGGNKNAQKRFYQLFRRNKENTFLLILKNKFDECFYYLKNEFEKISLTYIHQYVSNKDYLKKLKDITSYKNWIKKMRVTKMIFRFMQLLCEGHNLDLQEFLREQFTKNDIRRSSNINFIEIAAYGFGLIVKFLNPEIFSLGEHILDFIIESVQGPCIENQRQLFRAKIVDYCNDMFLELIAPTRMNIKGFYLNKNRKDLNSFVVKAVRLLNSLVEANNDKNLIDYMSNHIHTKYLIKHLTLGFLDFVKKIPKFKKFFKIYEKSRNRNFSENFDDYNNEEENFDRVEDAEEIYEDFDIRENNHLALFDLNKFLNIINFSKFDSKICALFEIYFLLQFLATHNEKIESSLNRLKENKQLCFQFFKKFTGQVEIVFNDKIMNFLFIIHPCCFYVEKKQLNYLLRGIKRDTPKDKVKDIILFSKNIFLIMEHRCKLHYKFKKFGINLSFYNGVNITITLVGAAINLFMIFFFKKRLYYGYAIEDLDYNDQNLIFMILGYVLFVLSLFRLFLWFVIHGSVEIQKFMHKLSNNLKFKIKNF